MQQLPCPKCSTPIPVRVETADDRGRVRLACLECDAKVLIKVNPRALKLSPDIPQTKPEPEVPTVRLSPEEMAVWAVVVHALDGRKVSKARRFLLTLPRFRSNPNKLHDATNELPFIISGLKRKEAAFLEEAFEKLSAKVETGPQVWLLDEDLEPIPPDVRGPLPLVSETWTGEFEAFDAAVADVDVSFDLSESRSGNGSWLSFDGGEDNGTPSLPEIDDESLVEIEIEALTDIDSLSDTEASESVTNEVVVEEFEGFDFGDPFESGLALPDTEEGANEGFSQTNGAFPVVTIDRLPGLGVIYGGVQARVAITSTVIGDSPDDAIASALASGEQQLASRASALGASGVVGLRTSQSAVPGPSGWLWILILSGTAVGR